MSRSFVVFLISLLLAAGASATAQDGAGDSGFFSGFSFTSRKEPIQVSSKRLDFDYKNRRTLFHGEVEVVQGDIRLQSDRLTVEYAEDGGQQKLQEVAAEGNVTITQGERRASGDRATFDETNRTLVLTGRARLQEGSNQVNGDTIIVYPDESRMEIKGDNSRVKLIIFPGQTSSGSSAPTAVPNGPE